VPRLPVSISSSPWSSGSWLPHLPALTEHSGTLLRHGADLPNCSKRLSIFREHSIQNFDSCASCAAQVIRVGVQFKSRKLEQDIELGGPLDSKGLPLVAGPLADALKANPS
jgi:hypothetical protein